MAHGGRPMAHGGRFVAEMNEEATDERPCQPSGEPLVIIIPMILICQEHELSSS